MANGARHPRRQAIEPSAFAIALSKSDGRALFMEVHEQIVDRIAAGELTPGMRLPLVRLLAKQLSINHMTVAKAYKDLSEAGFVEGRAGSGTHVRGPNGAGSKLARESETIPAEPLLSERLYELACLGRHWLDKQLSRPGFRLRWRIRSLPEVGDSRRSRAYFSYDPPNGRVGFRRCIVDYLAGQGVVTAPEDVIVISGAQ